MLSLCLFHYVTDSRSAEWNEVLQIIITKRVMDLEEGTIIWENHFGSSVPKTSQVWNFFLLYDKKMYLVHKWTESRPEIAFFF